MNIKNCSNTGQKPTLLVVGSGILARSFTESLAQSWNITLVLKPGTESANFSAASTIVSGNATDLAVLRHAGGPSVHCVVAATDDDFLNLEICKLAIRVLEASSTLGLVRDEERLEEFNREEVPAVHLGTSIALAAETHLQAGARAASGIGLGQGEIFEVEVLPGSTAIGKTPRHLNPQSWLLAAIYRQGELIVPHGDTEICEGDSVVLVGQPEILSGVANFFRAGTSEFPLQYGAQIVGLPEQKDDRELLQELQHLAQSTEATGWSVLETVPADMSRALDSLDSGCTVVRAPRTRWFHKFGLSRGFFRKYIECQKEPVFISRGTSPYQKVALGIRPGMGARFAAEMAVDFAKGVGAELTAIMVVPSTLVTGEEYPEQLEKSLQEVQKLAEVYGIDLKTETVEGNPVMALAERSADYDLLVLAHRIRARRSYLQPDVSKHLILRSQCSVLCLPHRHE